MDLLRGPSSGLSRVRRVAPPIDSRVLWWTLHGGRAKMRGWLCWGGGWVGHLKFRHGPGAELVPPTVRYSTISRTYFTPVLRCILGPSDLSCFNHRACCPHHQGQAQVGHGGGLVVSMVWVQSCWLSAQEQGISPLPTKGHLPPPDPRGLSM